jgi:GNAT superfamily N-acetyltransferase
MTSSRTVITTYLEMTDPTGLRPPSTPRPEMEVRQARIPCPELNRFLYASVGGNWFWTDRLPWSYQQWLDYLDRAELKTWVAYVEGTPAGYFELEKQPDNSVEIAYFGLLPSFIGKGLGGWLLTHSIERAWEMAAARVWVHTCNLDGPAALSNYQARGLRIYRVETAEAAVPDRALGPWPGAQRGYRCGPNQV